MPRDLPITYSELAAVKEGNRLQVAALKERHAAEITRLTAKADKLSVDLEEVLRQLAAAKLRALDLTAERDAALADLARVRSVYDFARLESERDALREALRPFAGAAACAENDENDDYCVASSSARYKMTLGDLREARRAYEQDADGKEGLPSATNQSS